MTSILLTALIAFLAGVLVTWILRKLLVERSLVPIAVHEDLATRHQQAQTHLATLEERLRATGAELASCRNDLSALDGQLRSLRELLAKEQTNGGILKGERDKLLEDLQALRSELQFKNDDWMNAKNTVAELRTKLEHQSALYDKQKADLQTMTDTMRKDFSVLAHQILDEKSKAFNESQQKELNTLLEPLKLNLTDFRSQVEKVYKAESDERTSLKEQVKLMMDLNKTLTKEAHALTQALSGNTKKQGDWGEWILETILDYCGLQKGVHYVTQESGHDEEGTRIRPDVIVKYPDDRALVIDSKVSLSHYEQLLREEHPDAQAILVKQLVQSIRNHIDGLSSKKYTDLKNSLDMVIMFLPVEAAYITALQNDPGLQQYAYKKNVLMVSPANLVVAMKLILDMWNRDAINKNAEAISDSAGKLYDKLVAFLDDLQKVGRAMDTMQSAYHDAHKKLYSGKGSLISRAEKMKALKINSSKSMPKELAGEIILEDDNNE